jgi:hypothetical protein
MSHDDFAFEPVRGLPAKLPEGEELLWQGAPAWRAMAMRAYHARKIALYFLALMLVRIAFGINDGIPAASVALSCLWILTLGALAAGTLSFLAYLSGRMTVYSVTSERILIRHGIAVPITVNIPFALIESADLKQFSNGTGDISFSLPAEQRIGYLVTWPHVRPGYFARPQPSFRALPEAARAAETLGRALAAHAGVNAVRVTRADPTRAADGVEPGAAPA